MKIFYKSFLSSFAFLLTSLICAGQQNAIIKTERNSPIGIVSFSENAKFSGAGNTKHVDGYAKKYGNAFFVFPVGQNGSYGPFAAEADATLGAYFKSDPGVASIPQGGPFTTASKDSSIKSVSNKEFWDVNGSKATKLALSWNANSDVAGLTGNSLQLLTIVGWSPAKSRWEKIESVVDEIAFNGGESTLTAGSITSLQSVVPDEYTIYSIGSLNAASQPISFEGIFESAGCFEIKGWVWDKNHPNSSMAVELIEGTTIFATATANIFRDDLKATGKGTGNYGFSFQLPASLMSDGLNHQFSIRVRNSTFILGGSPKALSCSLGGNFARTDCYAFNGWAWDKNNQSAALTIELLDGNDVFSTFTAGNYWESLKNAGYGTGKYGFTQTLPASLKDGRAHSLSARVKGTNYLLPGSPYTATCSVSQFQGNIEFADCNTIAGWAWDKTYPNSAVTVELVEGNTVYATALANIYKESVKNAGYGTGIYGFSMPLPAALKDGNAHQLSIRVKGSTTLLDNSPRTLTCGVNQYQGALDTPNCNTISGWAWDKNFPAGSALIVEVVEGNVVHGSATANIYRSQLQTAGFGTGNYGFTMDVPNTLKDGKAHQLSLRVKGSTLLLGETKTITCAVNQYFGIFEYAGCNAISGWAWDKNAPNSAVTVELVEGNTVYASVLANNYKESVKNAGFGTGNYGFNFPVPAALNDGQAHQLSIRVQGSTTILNNSSRALTCAANLYQGALDTPNCNTISGWAWDKNLPNGSALTIELVEGNVVHGTATANIYRESLKTAGIGTGNYSFTMAMPGTLKDGKAHQLSLRVKGSTLLLGETKTITCAVNQYFGIFEYAGCNAISGWAWDKNAPNSALTVELVEGNTVYATVLANNYKESVKNAGFGTGNYGFNFPVPAALNDGQAHQLSIRVQGSTTILNNSPRTLTCAANLYQGALDTPNCNTISGWAWDKNLPTGSALTIELVEGNVVHGTATANIYRESLKTAGIGTGNYSFTMALPSTLKDGKAHQLSLRIKGSTLLLGETKTITCAVSQYFGNFEYAGCNAISGWAWDKNAPNSAVTVELVEGNTVYATVLANIYKESVKNAGFGTGNYGFNFPVPAALNDGQAHQLSIRVQGSTTILNNSPRALTCAANLYQGALDTPNCNTISGWAWDKNLPNGSALTIELVEGNVVHGSATANIYRESLKTAGIGTGNYSFTMALPSTLKDGKAHQLSLRVKGSTLLLGDTKTITCAVNQYFGNFEYAGCNAIAGWAWDKNAPNSAVTIELLEENTVHATALANIFKQSVQNAGFGTGNYGFSFPLPTALKDGNAHQLTVRVQGSTTMLMNSPKSVNCAVSARISAVDDNPSVSARRENEAEVIEVNLLVTPNPTNGKIQVTANILNEKPAKISVINILGQVVWEGVATGADGRCEQVIDLSQHTNGIYIVKLQTGEMIRTKRIVLTK